ncbi:MAG: 3-hydroxyisobutyrate dehydrogenase [Legionella sp.]|nr:3-hydroxyisobutyrate dehydrogenase [Legionella sp.]
MANIGFVGLGHMGLPMACNLIQAGHRVIGFDLQTSAVAQLAAAGGVAASELCEVAKNQDFLITMLQTGQQVLQVCSPSQGLFKDAPKGCLHIDCSTIDVQSSQQVHDLATNHQLEALDAPVSGGVAGAQAGTLTFMVGGGDESFAKAKPLLSCMGQKVIHAGPSGSGQAAKICNNMILGISMIAVAEAFVLAQALGLSAQKLFEVVSNASGQCWTMSKYVPVPGVLDNVPADHAYEPGFAALMMLKDLSLSQQCAKSVQVETQLGAKAQALYQDFIDKGFGDLDFSAIIQQIKHRS